jgi:hypothetical protein
MNMFDSEIGADSKYGSGNKNRNNNNNNNENFYDNVGPIPFANTLNMALQQSQLAKLSPTHSLSATISHSLAQSSTQSPRSKILESPRLRKARQQHNNSVSKVQHLLTAPDAGVGAGEEAHGTVSVSGSHSPVPPAGGSASHGAAPPPRRKIAKKMSNKQSNSKLNLLPSAQGQAWITSVLDADDPDEQLLAQVYEAGFHEIMIEKGIIEDDLHPLRPLVRFDR